MENAQYYFLLTFSLMFLEISGLLILGVCLRAFWLFYYFPQGA